MIHIFVEAIFVAFPMTTIAAIASAVGAGYLFGPSAAIIGALVGLVAGILLEIQLQRCFGVSTRAKWTGIFFITALVCTIGVIAISTR